MKQIALFILLLIAVASFGSDINGNMTKLLITGNPNPAASNSNFIDRSIGGHHGSTTISASCSWNATDRRFGQQVFATNQGFGVWSSMPDSDDWSPLGQGMVVSFWCRFQTTNPGNYSIVGISQFLNSNNRWTIGLGTDTAVHLYPQSFTATGGNQKQNYTNPDGYIPFDTIFHHLVVSISTTGNVLQYLDGNYIPNSAYNFGWDNTLNLASPLYFGQQPDQNCPGQELADIVIIKGTSTIPWALLNERGPATIPEYEGTLTRRRY